MLLAHLEDSCSAGSKGSKHEMHRRLGDRVDIEEVEGARVDSGLAADVDASEALEWGEELSSLT